MSRPEIPKHSIPPYSNPAQNEGLIGPYEERRLKINIIRISVISVSAEKPTLIFRENQNRKGFRMKNNSANAVELVDSDNAVYGQGYPLVAADALTGMSPGEISEANYNPQGELWAIATGGASDVRVIEYISQERDYPTYPPYPPIPQARKATDGTVRPYGGN